ncbi:hypothetical protein GRI62_07015 [Erythrobacter arachoides]|uniref:Uncharacterized protein n=1 Tax=Aurantiacibacter arachoides TaxID=1850444 RepID=A0A844ZZN1_9SPHN|nr:hypothetical protein [Aurantiacibacter arachoides]MXO93355.1 hypothetical protein [Aurantiacibacter arachoides]GGD50041.1 hypothetical protein GCM10011411_07270 [Aurantiacibacter arachoides]
MHSAPALAALALSACVTHGDAAPHRGSPPAAEATPVGLGQAVSVGDLALTPLAVIEDSRCPINARCVWAGRIIVRTQVDGPAWHETRDLQLGEPQQVRGHRLALVSAEPGRMAGAETPPATYRFVFESGAD